MSTSLPLFALAALALGIVALWARLLTRPAATDEDRGVRNARFRGLLALTAAGLIGGATLLPGLFGTSLTAGFWYDAGLIALLSPVLAASAGMLVIAAVPPLRSAASARRSASLHPRRPLGLLRRRDRSLLFASTLGAAALVLLAGAFSSPDEFGRYRQLSMSTAGGHSSAGPYPGWFYGLPALALTLLLLASALLALRRIARAPAPTDSREHAADLDQRGALSRFVARLASGGALGITAFVLLLGGRACLGLAMNTVEHAAAILGTVAVVALLAGVLALLGALACLATAFVAVLGRRTAAAVGTDSVR